MSKSVQIFFDDVDTDTSISEATLNQLIEVVGGAQRNVVQLALRHFADEKLPRYPRDDSHLSHSDLDALKNLEPQGRASKVKASLF